MHHTAELPDFDLARRLRYAGVDAATGRRLRSFWRVARLASPGILDTFYRHVEAEPTLVRMINGRNVIEAEKRQQDEAIIASVGVGLHALAGGDLPHRVTTELTGPIEKLKIDFNAAVPKLQQAMVSVVQSIASISTGGREIEQASDDLSRRTENQAASLEQTAAALGRGLATDCRAVRSDQRTGHRDRASRGPAVDRKLAGLVANFNVGLSLRGPKSRSAGGRLDGILGNEPEQAALAP